MPTPFALLDGNDASIEATIAAASHKCWIFRWAASIIRDMSPDKTTFCSGGWRSRTPGVKQLVGGMDGFLPVGLTGGNVAVSPGSYFAANTPQAQVLTAGTGCSFTYNGHVTQMRAGQVAMLNSDYGLSFESDGPVTTAWVVT